MGEQERDLMMEDWAEADRRYCAKRMQTEYNHRIYAWVWSSNCRIGDHIYQPLAEQERD